jgi:S1-C subfamily serine protease
MTCGFLSATDTIMSVMRSLSLVVASLSVCVAVTLSAQAQTGGRCLPRRAWFGVALAPHESGALVTSVVEGSSAAVEGIRAGDVIRAVDDVAMRTPNEVIAIIGRHGRRGRNDRHHP